MAYFSQENSKRCFMSIDSGYENWKVWKLSEQLVRQG